MELNFIEKISDGVISSIMPISFNPIIMPVIGSIVEQPYYITSAEIHYYFGKGFEELNRAESSQRLVSEITVPEGEWVFYAMAQDQAGNEAQIEPQLLKVDTTLPTLSWTVTPSVPDGENGWYRTRPSLKITYVSSNTTLYWAWHNENDWKSPPSTLQLNNNQMGSESNPAGWQPYFAYHQPYPQPVLVMGSKDILSSQPASACLENNISPLINAPAPGAVTTPTFTPPKPAASRVILDPAPTPRIISTPSPVPNQAKKIPTISKPGLD